MALTQNTQEYSYLFTPIEFCNMCASSNTRFIGRRLNKSQGLFPKNKSGISVTIEKCKKCGLVFSNPRPTPTNFNQHYEINPEAYWHKNYFEMSDNYFGHEIETAKKLLPFKPNMKALDIGAGIGKAIKAISNSGFDAYGFEPSKEFYNMAIERLNISPDKIKVGKVEDVEYPENSFEFITFGAVLEHLPNPSESIKKAVKWLKPGGVIHIEVPSSKWLTSKIYNLYYKLTLSNFVTNISPMHSPYHLYEFTHQSFAENGKLNGYQIAYYKYHVCNTHLPVFINPIIKPLMKYTNTGMQLEIWLKK